MPTETARVSTMSNSTGFAQRRQRVQRLLMPLIFPVCIIVAWQVVTMTGLVGKALPSPSQVISAWFDLVTGITKEAGRYSGTWGEHALSSVWRVILGFAWSTALGVTVGILIGLSRFTERLIDPTIQVLRNVPVTAWVPLSLIFFGIGDKPAIFLIGLGAFFPAALNTTHGVRQVNQILYKSALMMGASRSELVLRVILPAALPSIMTGLRLSMGIAWVLVVVAEILAVRSGLGYLLNDAYQFYRNDIVIASMFSIGLLGYLSDLAIVFARGRLLQWNTLESFNG